MAEPHLDHPGEITWFKNYGPLPIIGPLTQDCDHDGAGVVAWGPDMQRYTLDECRKCGCRAWHSERPFRATTPWLQVKQPAVPPTDEERQ